MLTVIAPEHVQDQSEINICLECDLQDCVFVDPAIDEYWCNLTAITRQVVMSRGNKNRLSDEKIQRLRKAESAVKNAETPLSVAELAKQVGVTTRAIDGWIAEGFLVTEKERHNGMRKPVIKEVVGLNGNMTFQFRCEQHPGGSPVVYHKPPGITGSKVIAFESANPYLAIAAIAMELAKSYAD